MGEVQILDSIYAGVVDADGWRGMLGQVARQFSTDFAVSCRGFDDTDEPVDWIASERMPIERIDSVFSALRDISASSADAIVLEGETREFSFVGVASGGETDHRFLFGWNDRASRPRAHDLISDYAQHLMRAAQLREKVSLAADQARNALTLLDMLRIPVMLVDRNLQVVIANSAVQKLEKEGVLRFAGRELRFSSVSAMERARRAIEGIADGAEAGSDLLIRLEMASGNSFLAMIEPLTGVFMDAEAAPSTAVAAILLKDPERVALPTEAALRELHEMPPSEARLAAAMAEGLTIREYSQRENLSETYIRDLSKQVMSRLGVNRQPDLVRAIVRLASDFDKSPTL